MQTLVTLCLLSMRVSVEFVLAQHFIHDMSIALAAVAAAAVVVVVVVFDVASAFVIIIVYWHPSKQGCTTYLPCVTGFDVAFLCVVYLYTVFLSFRSFFLSAFFHR